MHNKADKVIQIFGFIGYPRVLYILLESTCWVLRASPIVEFSRTATDSNILLCHWPPALMPQSSSASI